MAGRFPPYARRTQGFATALGEENYAFDVLFAGDGHYVRDRLANASLAGSRVLLVPSPVDPTPNQRRIVRTFVLGGGILICQEPERLGFPVRGRRLHRDLPTGVRMGFGYGKGRVLVLTGEVTATATGDLGAEYFRTYRPELRLYMARLAASVGLAPIAPRQVARTRRRVPGRADRTEATRPPRGRLRP